MIRNACLVICLICGLNSAKSQSFDSLKLKDSEIPAGYKKSNDLLCRTPHASSLYDQANMFEVILGKVDRKDFQSFDKKGDSGSILYFQFQKDFTAQAFLAGLLWGSDGKPGKSEPDEYFAKGNILVIWSLNFKSTIKSLSQQKVQKILE